ncbi:insecticidal toxin complex protein TccC [Pseudomonas sp. SJZ080]|uniref:RHS repeat domain-containing protein n=1 Tax=Pseudomonas sp. SJZ080 TaxID=2572888 RepID=UPI00119ADABF|nr:RHS repeat-associated core domain-containing protein [Pseudomonas sp. SJZ080]TWC59258.1 insecticidal toxin complex protein TccC [Pseudomonas sp. SJZ080]
MDIQVAAMHRHTPKLIAIDPRGLAVRSVDHYRAGPGDMAEAHVERTTHDQAGRSVAQWDPRMFLEDSALANLSTAHGLSGTVLYNLSVDAGLRVSLFGEAGQSVQSWDGRGSQHWMHYDNQLRLTALFEQAADGEAVCAERLNYAANDQAFVDHNQCGRLICHEDPAGAVLCNDYGLSGGILEQERRFAKEPSPGFATHSRFNPLNDLLSRTDAQGNEQRFSQTVGGQLRAVDLRLNNTLEWLPMVSAIACNAHGQVEREVAGNGVITILKYTAEDGRLQRLVSRLGQNEPLQDLRYAYDPVGNVLSIEDAALPIRYFANQRIEPVSHYWYDTLYRLIEATGWEAGSVNHGPSSAMTADPATPGNYRQTYRYDAGNNLLELTHVGPQNHGHRLVAEAHSNRCLPVRDGLEPGEDDFRIGFDANGNLLSLQPGQTLSWDLRNQLREVRPVKRDAGPDDCECYDYGADGMRVRKVRSLQTNAQTVVIETRYLPGVEIRTHSGTGEVLHVIDVTTGRGSVRVLHWEAEKPNEITNNQQRYSLTDHLGSSTLELDQDARLITQERYYPFGGTAWSNGMAVQVSYKTVRYSGKEQDATGLYYYGFRYYVSWLQRWLNVDPAGPVDGLNLYRMVRNCPLGFRDEQGLAPISIDEKPTDKSAAPVSTQQAITPVGGQPLYYRVDYLESRLLLADTASQGRAIQVQDNFDHKINERIGSIVTTPKQSMLEKPSKFFNIFTKSEWEFKSNYKYSDSGGVFLNDVSRGQIRLVADLNYLPSVIRRSKVLNETTLTKTAGLESGSEELFKVFFSETPNGKATQRLMDEVGLKATAVTKEVTGGYTDFIVAVIPTGPYEVINAEKPSASRNMFALARAKRQAALSLNRQQEKAPA